ncbi:acyltransferase family protein [Caulobacter sp.]|uniref:acyltransferase family protein n=1 Tax=Caulobacter sp. TaxID=78 RepID=UPI003BA88100
MTQQAVVETRGDRGGVLKNVQVLRAIAAYLVVFYHARVLTPIESVMPVDFGNAGVDIFFVISGFIIAHVSRQGDFGRPGAFMAKRVVRIAPIYWLITLFLFAMALVTPGLAGAAGPPTGAMLIKSLLFIPYFDGSGAVHPVLFVGWTLNNEMFFYLVFAAALLIRREVLRLAVVSAALLALVGLGLVSPPRGAPMQTYTDPLMIEFVAGMWLSLVYRLRSPAGPLSAGRRISLLLLGATMFGVLVLGDSAWPHLHRVVKWGLPAIAIMAVALWLEQPSASASAGWRIPLLLGEASYSIYLTHPFVIKAADLVRGRLPDLGPALDATLLVLVLISVGVAGVMTHLLLEKPILAALRPVLKPRVARGST